MRYFILGALIVLALAGCDQPSEITAPDVQAQFAKGGGKPGTPPPEPSGLIFEIQHITVDGAIGTLRGDGKTAYGAASGGSSIYENGVCGVEAMISEVSGNGLLTMQASKASRSCGGKRVGYADLGYVGDAYAVGITTFNHVDVRCLLQVAGDPSAPACPYPDASPGNPGIRPFGVATTNAQCERLRWFSETYGGGDPTQVTFDGVVGGKRQWTAESLPPHTAGCYSWQGGTYVWDGQQRVVPFKIVMREK